MPAGAGQDGGGLLQVLAALLAGDTGAAAELAKGLAHLIPTPPEPPSTQSLWRQAVREAEAVHAQGKKAQEDVFRLQGKLAGLQRQVQAVQDQLADAEELVADCEQRHAQALRKAAGLAPKEAPKDSGPAHSGHPPTPGVVVEEVVEAPDEDMGDDLDRVAQHFAAKRAALDVAERVAKEAAGKRHCRTTSPASAAAAKQQAEQAAAEDIERQRAGLVEALPVLVAAAVAAAAARPPAASQPAAGPASG